MEFTRCGGKVLWVGIIIPFENNHVTAILL